MNNRISLWAVTVFLMNPGSMPSFAAGNFGAIFEVSSLNGSNGFVINGAGADDRSGMSVSYAGDLNNDGVNDLIIGAYLADGGAVDSGACYVVFGGAGVGTSGSIELSSLDGGNGFVINGIAPGDRSGAAISAAGDVNDDGVDDLIIGASRADPGSRADAGQCHILFGGEDIGKGGTISLKSVNGANGFVLNGVDPGDLCGSAVAAAGDVNNDGVDDVIIGAYSADPGGTSLGERGESYVIFGGAGIGASGSLELSSLNGANGFVCKGANRDERSGWSVSPAGDVNSDGIDDLIIGAYQGSGDVSNSGRAYVLFGGEGIGSGGSIALNLLGREQGFVIKGNDRSDRCGWSVAPAGDFNSDGADDLVISAILGDPGGYNSGESYVIFGGEGLGAPGVFQPSSLDGKNGFVLNGATEIEFSGWFVSPAGDANGDGSDDLLIGARPASGKAFASGLCYLVFGGKDVGADGSVDLSELSAIDGARIVGIGRDDNCGESGSGLGDFNDDGVHDLVIGAHGGNPNGIRSGESYIIFGRCAPPADLNADCDVNTTDLAILIDQFGTPGPAADLNNDGVVDTADLGALIGSFGQ